MSRLFRVFLTFAALAALTLPVANCAQQVAEFKSGVAKVKAVVAKVSNAKIDRKYVVAAAKITNALITTGDIYLQQPVGCAQLNCRNPAATEPIIAAKKTAAKARNDALQFILAHPGPLGDRGVYDALVTAWTNLQGIYNAYGVNYTIPQDALQVMQSAPAVK